MLQNYVYQWLYSAVRAELCWIGMLLRHTLVFWIVLSTEHYVIVAERPNCCWITTVKAIVVNIFPMTKLQFLQIVILLWYDGVYWTYILSSVCTHSGAAVLPRSMHLAHQWRSVLLPMCSRCSLMNHSCAHSYLNMFWFLSITNECRPNAAS